MCSYLYLWRRAVLSPPATHTQKLKRPVSVLAALSTRREMSRKKRVSWRRMH